MRILLITDALPPAVLGGSGRIVWETATGLARNGHDVTVLTSGKQETFPMEKDGVRILTIEPRGKRWAHYRSVFSKRRAREVMTHVKNVKPDVIHAHLIAGQAGYKWILDARRKHIPVIVTCHDVMHTAYGRVHPGEANVWLRDMKLFRWEWNPFRNMLIRNILNNNCTVVTVSNALRIYMESMDFTNLQTVHNGVDLEFWKPGMTKQEARAALHLPQDKTIFLLAGRLGPDKGTGPVAAAFPSDAHLVVAGTLRETIFDSFGDRLHVLENQSAEQMRTLYTACDVVLVPSLCLDCFPTVCLESMAMERPVIATDMGGAKESVDDGKTGWILDPRRTDAFADRMHWCMNHPADTEAMGKAGRERMMQSFSRVRFLADMEAVYGKKPMTVTPLRIALLTPDIIGRNGWSRYALDIGKTLAERGHSVHCIVGKKTGATWCREYRAIREPTGYLNNAMLRTFDALRLRLALRRIKPDIVHVMAEPCAMLLPALGRRTWKTCMTIHGTYSVLPFLYDDATKQLFEEGYELCDTIVSVSQFTKNYVKLRAPDVYRKADLEKKIIVLPNAIDLRRFPFIEKKTSATRKNIISVSGVKPKKGYEAAIDAVALFRKKHNVPLTYDIFGSLTMAPDFVKKLREKIDSLNLHDVVTLRGSVDDKTLEDAYAHADAFLLPSLHEGDHFEGFGLVFLEANAYGTPVIGGATGGIPEAISEGKSGYTCHPEDIEGLAKRLEDILIRNAIKPSACREWAEDHAVEKTAIDLEELYRTLIGK